MIRDETLETSSHLVLKLGLAGIAIGILIGIQGVGGTHDILNDLPPGISIEVIDDSETSVSKPKIEIEHLPDLITEVTPSGTLP